MNFNFFSKNGQILPIDQASIPLSNIAYQYGFGVYESIKVRNNILYFVDQHVERLFTSADVIGLHHTFTKEQIKQFIKDLIIKLGTINSSYVIPAKAGIQNIMDPRVPTSQSFAGQGKPEDDKEYIHFDSYNLKVLLIGGENPLLFIIPLAPHFPDRKLYSEGAKTITFHYERLFPHAKTLNMLPSYIAYKKAKEHDCYDALLIDSSKNIIEGTRTNFFAIRGNVLISPPKEKILEGVTKLTVLSVAQQHGFTVEEKDIPLADLSQFDGAFLTSTSAKIVPIKQIDDFIFLHVPEKLKELMHLYDNFLKESKGILFS